jgi:sigma-B regulation protein RsbU (phosphoserine phosphatase)
MAPGDRLYLMTDGVIEAENAAEQEFGVERLRAELERNRSLSLSDSLTEVVACAERWCAPSAFADDVSFLAVEICSPDPGRPSNSGMDDSGDHLSERD